MFEISSPINEIFSLSAINSSYAVPFLVVETESVLQYVVGSGISFE
jgi:hypothetical protein